MPGDDASAAHPHHPPQLSSRLGKLIALTPLLCSYGSYFLTYKKGLFFHFSRKMSFGLFI